MAFGKAREGRRAKASHGSGGAAYAPVEPGYYLARVESGAENTFDSKKGVTYLKVTPEIVLLNEVKTKINRQDIVIGAVDEDGYLYRPDGDDDKPALFSEAGFFLSALGFVTVDEDGEEYVAYEEYSTQLLVGQIIRVKVDNESYTSRDGDEKQKNIVTGFYALGTDDIAEHDLYFDEDSGMVFEGDTGATTYAELREQLLLAAENGDEHPF